jgi:hypothetical protein
MYKVVKLLQIKQNLIKPNQTKVIEDKSDYWDGQLYLKGIPLKLFQIKQSHINPN